MERHISIFMIVYIFVLLFSIDSYSRPGDLDPTFGNGTGKVITMFPTATDDQVRNMKLQADDKIIAVGFAGPVFAVARYNTDGSLDETFGTNGLVTTDFPGFSPDFATTLTIQPDAKIIISGAAGTNFALARYLIDGSLDQSFGLGGLVTTTFSGPAVSRGNALQPDGKILLGGNTVGNFAIARYNTDGSLDTSFNPNGVLPGTQTTSLGIGSTTDGFSLARQDDGKIVIGGRTNATGITSFALARYNTDGSLDTSFNPQGSIPGTVITDFGTVSDIRRLELQPDGKILAGGRTNLNRDFIVARYNPDGSLDTSFGSGGFTITNVGPDMISAANALALQPDGKILLGGRGRFGGNDSFALIRYLNNGQIDTSFGSSGIVVTDFPGLNDSIEGLAIQSDGRIVAAGYAGTAPTGRYFAVARYLNDALTITKKASSHTPCPGQNITYTIIATNFGAGGGVVNGIFIEDVVPPELIFQSAKTKGTQSSFDPTTLIWSIPRLCIDESAQLKINARVQQFVGNQEICNTAITTYSSIDNITDSSLFESLSIFDTEVFSTTECISTLPVVFENINHIAQRADCGLFGIDQELCNLQERISATQERQLISNATLDTLLLKLDCMLGF